MGGDSPSLIPPASAMKKTGSGGKNTKVTFSGHGHHKDSLSNGHSNGSSVRSITSLPSLHLHLMRTHKNRDPFQYYEVLKILGDGSMGSVSKVKKRKYAVGGSARKAYLQMQHQSKLLKILPCLSFCLPGSEAAAEEETKPGALVDSDDIDNRSSVGSESSSILKNESKQQTGRKPQHSSMSTMVSYRADYGVVYALKSIILDHVTNDVYVRELQNEIAILSTLDHPNICKAIETYEFKNHLYLVLELCSGGDLYSRDPYDEKQARHIIHSILDACTFLHRRQIAHRDLKYENIMFASPTSPNIKIIDFGLSKTYHKNQMLSQTVGTVYTMAPEVIQGKYGELCDVWSTGVLAFMLLSSSLPFFGKSRNDVIKRIMSGKFKFKARRWQEVSQEAKDFVTSILIRRVDGRPSAEEALKHKWFHGSKASGGNSDITRQQIVSSAVMDRVQATIQTFAGYSKLKKLALYVIAYKSSADEIGFLQQLFRNRFDVQKDGVVNLQEFKEALSVYSYTDDELEWMFDAMNIDGCDDISYSEFLAATIEAHGSIEEDRIAEAFDRLDSDDTGYITVANLTDFLGEEIPEEYVDAIIDEVDLSHDHKIDYDEFLKLWDDSFDEILAENLKDVRKKRLIRDSEKRLPSFDEGQDGSFLEEEKSEEASDHSLDWLLDVPGAGKYYFEQEKEKSMRGVWV